MNCGGTSPSPHLPNGEFCQLAFKVLAGVMSTNVADSLLGTLFFSNADISQLIGPGSLREGLGPLWQGARPALTIYVLH